MQTPTAPAPQRRSAVYWALSDNWELSKRSVRHIKRDPDQLASVTIQPIILVVLFRYFIGGAIRTGSSDTYINFLMAGIFIETAALTATTTGTSVAADMLGGSIDRFRSLPVMKSAVLTGHIVADLLRASPSAWPSASAPAPAWAAGWPPWASRSWSLSPCAGYRP